MNRAVQEKHDNAVMSKDERHDGNLK